MKLGLAFFPTEHTLEPGRVGSLAEQAGFELLLFAEHTNIPVSRETPFPAGGELPAKYMQTFDPFVALTAAAAATSTIRLGTGACLLAQRDPIVTAKAAATLDQISGGRFEFGVGAGWNVEETRNHGVEPGSRFAVIREHVEAVKRIWTQDEAEFSGKHVSFEALASWPKPKQKPHPPVLVGGFGPRVLERVVAYGDGWLPNRIAGLGERIAELHELCARAGRPPLPVTVYNAPADAEQLRELEQAGVDRAAVMLESNPPEQVERDIARLGQLVEAVA